MSSAPEADVDEWLGRAADRSSERRAINESLLESVRERGYSLLAARPEVIQHHNDVLSEFEQSGGMPRHDRAVREVTSELAELFSPELQPGEQYDLASIVVRIPTKAGLPGMALRMTGLPQTASTEQIELWITALRRLAATVES